MSFKAKDNKQAELRQLWAGKVPPLTPEQTEVSLKLWQKIKVRRQREEAEEGNSKYDDDLLR